MSFLLVGGDSEIAGAALAVLRAARLPANVTTRRRDTLCTGRVFLDLTAQPGDWRPPEGTSACCIFAAVGHLVACARDPAGSAAVNCAGTIALVERLAAGGAHVLYLSTDKIFDGSRPLVPADALPAPRSEYGRQKARTDLHLQGMIARGAPVGILRLARIVPRGWALVRQWRDDLAAGRVVRPFRDMMTAPTLDRVAAAAIVALLRTRETGIWQLSGAHDVSYAEIASFIAERIGADPDLVQPVAAASAGMPEGSTPRHTTLDCSALGNCFGISPQDPREVIEEVLGLPPRSPRHP